jgi:8-oxo-dGTP pyrophosphatase MutT (NUDIX family)/phosphohistidine phosphatase SixA
VISVDENTETISAAGAVLWRYEGDGAPFIALIHRPRYDDWSFPKGKLETGESHIACAYREVLEETGVTSIFGPELGQTRYDVGGVTKVVRYWAAQASDVLLGQPNPTEVDCVEWLSIPEAREKLTRDDDKSILDVFTQFGPDTAPLILLRHAKAVSPTEWEGDDGDRPLDTVGQRQAKRLLPNYLPYQIEEIHSSDAMRCIETIEPLARALKINIVISEELGEYRNSSNRNAAFKYAQDVLETGTPAIICSHNPILPMVVRKLIGKKTFKQLNTQLNPGEAWILHHREGDIVAIDWMPSPTM